MTLKNAIYVQYHNVSVIDYLPYLVCTRAGSRSCTQQAMPFGVEFAPLRIPLERRLQTLGVLVFVLLFLIGHLAAWAALLVPIFLYPPSAPFLVGYLVWIYTRDAATPSEGGRCFPRMRRLGLWKHFAAYFPIGLQKTAELDPEKNYLFAYHPHGILGIGAFAAFGTEALDFSKTFPGITPHLMTLDMNFKPPFLREFVMSMGACAVNRKSCANILQSGPGESIAIVVGGAAEALEAKSKTATLVLKERMGFVKVALQTG